ncbi:Protein of unknown function [Pyronema omphalodes CBS 100304]|uniref:Uncharacterized protein n=1 Tax=Pyronema omphalodes (strain CBS 100304) TaxID=1076935 RepID=U4LNW9_PYROM|nr:Protein of unknown function [Pyronema omphalodes CBS 100304]
MPLSNRERVECDNDYLPAGERIDRVIEFKIVFKVMSFVAKSQIT